MNAIRNLATSTAAYGAACAIAGGAGAAYSGGDILGGAAKGAAMGVGGRLGAGAISGARVGGDKLINKGLSRLGASGMSQNRKGKIGDAVGQFQMRLNRMGSGSRAIGGMAGAGLGYSTLSSNQGLNVTHRNATLAQKLQYDTAKAKQQSAVRLTETMMKKQIWQPGAY